MNTEKLLTVTQLNMYVKSLLESSSYLKDIMLTGEISNFTNHYKTGHFYLSLKDETGLIKAVMFRQYTAKLAFEPKNGIKVICKGRVSLYEKDGSYQFYIYSMQPDGQGDLQQKYEQLRQKLEKEGLFDREKKKKIPKIPTKIGVITSPTGAALQDILNVLSRRFPAAEVVLCPSAVQGELAAKQLTSAVRLINRQKAADVIIIGRGGGSIEDLWAFNDETLARTIAASDIPVISAVGHETDFTICDFAADMRAPTPSASAELAVPDKAEVLDFISAAALRLKNALNNGCRQKKLLLAALSGRQCMTNPLFYIQQKSQSVDMLTQRTDSAYALICAKARSTVMQYTARLDSLSPSKVLLRGYTAVTKGGKTVSSASALNSGDDVTIRFHDGERKAVVE